MTDAEKISRFARVDPRLAELVVTAATLGGHSLRALRGPSKNRELVLARRWVVKRARGRFTHSETGRVLNRDSSTVIHHERMVREDIEPGPPGRRRDRQLELLPALEESLR